MEKFIIFLNAGTFISVKAYLLFLTDAILLQGIRWSVAGLPYCKDRSILSAGTRNNFCQECGRQKKVCISPQKRYSRALTSKMILFSPFMLSFAPSFCIYCNYILFILPFSLSLFFLRFSFTCIPVSSSPSPYFPPYDIGWVGGGGREKFPLINTCTGRLVGAWQPTSIVERCRWNWSEPSTPPSPRDGPFLAIFQLQVLKNEDWMLCSLCFRICCSSVNFFIFFSNVL